MTNAEAADNLKRIRKIGWFGIDRKEVIDLAIKALENAPTLSPDEVRGVGEWISDFDGCSIEFYKDGFVGGSCHCSKCGDHLDGSAEYAVKGKYCPSCGARMKGAEDGTTDNS